MPGPSGLRCHQVRGKARGIFTSLSLRTLYRGLSNRSLGQPHRSLLEQAERRIYEARSLEEEAAQLERGWQDLGRDIHREINSMKDVARKRAEIIEEQKEQEREVARLGETLALYKREVANCQTAAREHQQEADSLTREAGQKVEQARELEERASRLEEEAER